MSIDINVINQIVQIDETSEVVQINASGGIGVPSGGLTNQVLAKNSNTNYDFKWTDNNAQVYWGQVSGTLSNQTDLQSALDLKVPTSRTLTINGVSQDLSANRTYTIDALPSQTGNSGKYLTTNGTIASWGVIDLSGYVPYTGANANLDLGTFDLTTDIINLNQLKAISSGGLNIYSNSGTHIVLMGGGGGAGTTFYGGLIGTTASFASSGSSDTFAINHSSGSGIALNITKGGNGEGLYINKTSGSGNAATIIGTLNATTLVKSGGTSSQFLKADGSVDSTNYAMAIGNSITSATAGSVLFAGTSGVLQQDNANFFWDDTNNRLGIGTNVPTKYFELKMPTGVNTLNNGIVITRGSGTGIFLIGNGTSNVNNFIPTIYSKSSVDSAGFYFGASVFGTSSTFPAMEFQAQNAGQTGVIAAAQIVASFVNWDFTLMQIRGNGNLILQNGGTFTDGGERLQVNGTARVTGAVTFSSTSSFASTATFSVDAIINSINIGRGGGSLASNLRFGTNALNANTTGTQNIAIGQSSLIVNTTGVQNTAIGNESLFNNIIGVNNVAIGHTALRTNTGDSNTGVGVESMYYNISGGTNVAVGVQSLQRNSTGNNNVALGYQAGGESAIINYNSTGSNNIFIGYQSIGESGTESNRTWIGNSSTLSTWVGGSLLIGTRTDIASSILTLASTTKGFLPPRMTNAQRTAIASPAVGLMVYCTDAVEGLYIYKSMGWTFVI
jgi:hypothetical protein